MDKVTFNLWVNHLAKSIEDALQATKAMPMAELTRRDGAARFDGSGLYAIYYIGKHKPVLAYEPTAKRNRNGKWLEPIYVGVGKESGKTKSWRAGNHRINHATYSALRSHARSIESAVEHMALDIRDFYYKFIPIDPLNADIAERVLLDRHAPVWNSVVKGFANHHVGTTRLGQRRTRWDVLHMGRKWAAQCQWTPEGTDKILEMLRVHYLHRADIRKVMKKELKQAHAELQLAA